MSGSDGRVGRMHNLSTFIRNVYFFVTFIYLFFNYLILCFYEAAKHSLLVKILPENLLLQAVNLRIIQN